MTADMEAHQDLPYGQPERKDEAKVCIYTAGCLLLRMVRNEKLV